MEMNEESIKNLWVIVEKTHKQVLAMKFLGEFMGHRTKRFFQWSGKMGERF